MRKTHLWSHFTRRTALALQILLARAARPGEHARGREYRARRLFARLFARLEMRVALARRLPQFSAVFAGVLLLRMFFALFLDCLEA